MNQQRTHTAVNPGVMAANLFGAGKILEPLPIKQTALAGKLVAVYPMITKELFAQIMDRYREYAADYNLDAGFENVATVNHNEAVRRFLASPEATDTHKAFGEFFKKRIAYEEKSYGRKYTPREYNAMADEECAKYGPIVQKKKVHILKYASEMHFSTFLYMYNEQMMKKNRQRMNARSQQPLALPPFMANSWRVSQQKRPNGCQTLVVCNKTVNNHRRHFEEAGVFINGNFRGSKTSYEVDFNPKILTVFDQFDSTFVALENQSLSLQTWKELRKCPSNTSSFIRDKVDKKGNSTEFPDKVLAKPTALSLQGRSYRDTALGNVDNSPVGAAAETVKVAPTPSEKMISLLLPVNELDARLRTGLYDGYVPIKMEHLKWEAYNGTLTNQEFKEIVIQERLKLAAKLYTGVRITPGCWANTYKMLMDDTWRSFGHVWNKAAIVQDFESYPWRINYAVRWYKNKVVNPLYPSKYFDVRRRKKEEMGFEYTINAWKSHLEEPKRRAKRKAKLDKEAAKRQPQINHIRKYNRQIAKYEAKKIDIFQLSDYIQLHLPHEFYKKLADYLHTRQVEEMNRIYNA